LKTGQRGALAKQSGQPLLDRNGIQVGEVFIEAADLAR